MSKTPDSLFQFPCEFLIKVFGQASDEFEREVLTIIRKHIPDLHESALACRPSKDGKYLAISITITAQSKTQLDDIYRDLSANPRVFNGVITMTAPDVIVRLLGRQQYESCWHAMQQFTQQRDEQTIDEIWLLEHDPVFTQGQNGKPEHVLNAGDIPLLQTDRGGQVTYHGPGQLVAYVLLDLRRKKLNVRDIVTLLENSAIHVVANYGITALAKREAPGVYTDDKKICSVGLRIRKGCSYHGLALNVKMDLEPFSRINPCGFKQLTITQIADFKPAVELSTVTTQLMDYLIANLGYTHPLVKTGIDIYAR